MEVFNFFISTIRHLQFPDVYAKIKFFVEEFSKIKKTEIQSEINNLFAELLNAKRKDISFKMFTNNVKQNWKQTI